MKKITLGILYGVLILIFLISILISINIGAVKVSPDIIFKIMIDKIGNESVYAGEYSKATASIIWTLRLPRILIAGCVGAGLALSGVFMQALTKNSLADPFILGISSGASTGAVISILLGSVAIIGNLPLQVGAFAGALIAAGLVLVLGGSGNENSTTKLVLVGMAISSFFSAITNFILFISPESKKITSALFWMTGSFSGVEWKDVVPCIVTLCIGILFACFYRRELDAFLMGENYARNIGVHTRKVRLILLLVSTLLTAVMVSVSGVIGFVGLVIPHITRSMVGAVHRRMIPLAILIGAIFVVWADVIARVCAAPEEIPVGVITAMTGAPFFLFLLKKSGYRFGR